eukprot:scaffold32964_cov64-Phaeocystis_antarctica.AAC.3
MSTRKVPAGRWMECHGRFKRRAHRFSLIRVDVGIGQRRRARDPESTTLQANKAERVTFQRGDGTLHMGSIRGKAHPLPHTNMAMVSKPVGRWMKVQKASSPAEPD